MPKKYWKNLPEAQLIPGLIADSAGRVKDMLETPELPAKPAPNNGYLKSLREMNRVAPSGSGEEAAQP
jgi:DNA polymerase